MSEMLGTESRFYEDQRQRFLAEHGNQFVLIKNREVEGFYASRMEAVKRGYEHFGYVPFLVKPVS